VKKKVVLPNISYSCEEDEDEFSSEEEKEDESSSEEEEEDESSSEEEGEEESSSEEEGEEESSSPGEEGIKGKAYLGKDDDDESSSGEEEEEEPHVVRTILHFSSTKFIMLKSCHFSSPRPQVHVRYIGSIPVEVQDCKICDTRG
jgi:hypothetical protein